MIRPLGLIAMLALAAPASARAAAPAQRASARAAAHATGSAPPAHEQWRAVAHRTPAPAHRPARHDRSHVAHTAHAPVLRQHRGSARERLAARGGSAAHLAGAPDAPALAAFARASARRERARDALAMLRCGRAPPVAADTRILPPSARPARRPSPGPPATGPAVTHTVPHPDPLEPPATTVATSAPAGARACAAGPVIERSMDRSCARRPEGTAARDPSPSGGLTA